MDKQMNRMKNLENYKGNDRIITLTEKRAEVEKEEITPWAIKSGLPKLDNVVEGFRPGSLTVISGVTSQGKTSFCQTITRNISRQGIISLWFPFEGDIRDFLERLSEVTVESTIPAHLKGSRLDWIETRIIEGVAKYGVRVVFIDHLHYLLSLQSMNNSSLVIGGIVRQLKLIAQELNVVIFLICHIRKLQTIGTKGEFRRPSIEDLRDSSLVGQESDYVLFIWRKQDKILSTPDNPIWTNEAKLSLQKNRRTGRLCNVDLVMINKFFEEKEKQRDVFGGY